MATILGIDEAGRGAVIGPMVIAGVLIEKRDEQVLKELKVRDSKLLTVRQREFFYHKVADIAKDYLVIKIPANEIDELRKTKNLNRIEAEKMAEIIRALKPDVAVVDAPQVSADKFKQYLSALAKNDTEIIAENKADKNYPVVAAASVLAKVERDREIEKIKKMVGVDFGVGYSHDERTIKFLQELIDKDKKFPDFVRKSWITAIDIKDKKEQKTLMDWEQGDDKKDI